MVFNSILRQVSRFASSSWRYIKDFFKPPTSYQEYYVVGKFMISKKLVQIVFFILSLISIVYLIIVVPEKIMAHYNNKNNKVYTKYYNSRSLKSYSGVAQVVAKKSQAKYIGDVVKGVASGKGLLYDNEGNALYDGDFVNNEYTGKGTLYYNDGKVKYTGDFKNNKYNGEGKLYYENTQLNYEGKFIDGLKSGEGMLFDDIGLGIFKGIFINDKPSLERYLNCNVSKLKDSFLESELIYTYNDKTNIIYKKLGVMLSINKNNNTLNSDGTVNKIYVLDNKYFSNENELQRNMLDKQIDELNGVRSYTGYTKVLFNEMSVIDYLRKLDEVKYQTLSKYNFDCQYDDVLEAKTYRSEDKIYVQAYSLNKLEYTFYFSDRDDNYIFYSIERLS